MESAGQKIIVDYSVAPHLIQMKVAEHPTRTETVEIDLSGAKEISLLQAGEMEISGHEIYIRMKRMKMSVLDVRVMEELLAHPELIPDAWKTIKVCYFWGTIFRDPADNLCVAYLHWDGKAWRHGIDWLCYYYYGGEVFCLSV